MISWFMLSKRKINHTVLALDQPMAIQWKRIVCIESECKQNYQMFLNWLFCPEIRRVRNIYLFDTSQHSPRLESCRVWMVSKRQIHPIHGQDKTSIVCKSDKAGIATIRLMDATGALIFKGDQKVNVGENQLEIKTDVLNGKTGVIFVWNQDWAKWSCQW